MVSLLLLCMRELSRRAKLHLVKAAVISTLTYPDTILLTCSKASFYKLQKPLNRALKWVFNVNYPQLVTAKSLHERARLKPMNQIIYDRGKAMWDKILDGTAGDQNYANEVINKEYTHPHSWFPSSYARSRLADPPPIYTVNDIKTREAIQYYGLDQHD